MRICCRYVLKEVPIPIYIYIYHCHGSFDINNQSGVFVHPHKFSVVFYLFKGPRSLSDSPPWRRRCAEVYATARTWWLHGGRPGCPFSCRVHGPARCGPASLWNINMTRNIISHDSRRRGNTKYYPAEAPVGWPAGVYCSRRAVSCILLLAAARRTCSGHETR